MCIENHTIPIFPICLIVYNVPQKKPLDDIDLLPSLFNILI